MAGAVTRRPAAVYQEGVEGAASTWTARDTTVPRETASFAQVAEEHLREIYGYLVYMTGDRTVAEDLTAETFERALRAWSRYDPARGPAKAWLWEIARNTALNHLRTEARRRTREERYAGQNTTEAYEPTWGEAFSPELARALRELSPSDREVIALRVILELDTPTAARWLGITRSACSTRLNRALERLEEALTRVDDD